MNICFLMIWLYYVRNAIKTNIQVNKRKKHLALTSFNQNYLVFSMKIPIFVNVKWKQRSYGQDFNVQERKREPACCQEVNKRLSYWRSLHTRCGETWQVGYEGNLLWKGSNGVSCMWVFQFWCKQALLEKVGIRYRPLCARRVIQETITTIRRIVIQTESISAEETRTRKGSHVTTLKWI